MAFSEKVKDNQWKIQGGYSKIRLNFWGGDKLKISRNSRAWVMVKSVGNPGGQLQKNHYPQYKEYNFFWKSLLNTNYI